MTNTLIAWQKNEPHNNLLLKFNDEDFISYNPSAGADKSDQLGAMAQMIGGLFNGEGEPQEETALYVDGIWRILKYDARKDYETVFPDINKCINVYDSLKDKYRSEWSTD